MRSHQQDSPGRNKSGLMSINRTGYDQYVEQPETIPFIEEPLVFENSTEQVKIGFNTLDVSNIENYSSFSFTLSVTVHSRIDKLESDLIFFQTGTSTVDKNLICGISKARCIFLTFINHKRKPETIYSQLTLKTNQTYDVAIVFNFEYNSTDIVLYVNGQIEGMLSMGAKLQGLEGSAYFGSDININSFRGIISDPMVHLRALNNTEVREFLSATKSPTTSLYQQWRDKKEYESYTNSYSRHKKLPINLVRSFPVNQESYATIKQAHNELQRSQQSNNNQSNIQEQEEEEEELTHETILYKQTDTLKNYLLTNEPLYLKCREFSYNFEWILVTLQILSPPVEEKGMTPKLNFKCLHHDICVNSDYEPKFYPCYAIELDKFMKVINHVNGKLSSEDVISIAQVIDCLDNHPKYGSILLYEKFVLAIRNSCLSIDEIKELTKGEDELNDEEGDHIQEPKEKKGKLVHQDVYFDKHSAEPNFDSSQTIERNSRFSPKNLNVYVNKETRAIVGLVIEYMDTAVFEIASEKFECKGGYEAQECDRYNVSCEPDEDINQVIVGTFSDDHREFISYIEFRTTQGKSFVVGKELIENSRLKNVVIGPQEQLKGFFGTLTDRLHGFGLIIWQPVEEEEQEEEEEKVDITIIPEIPSGWNMGRFQIVMNHWTNWPRAQSTVGLQEADFVKKFNDLGMQMKDLFPNIEIIGNYDKPKLFGIFEVYVRGLGPTYEQDEQGRLFLFKNHSGGSNERFPRFSNIFDALCVMAMNYGDSVEMEKAQELYFKRFSNIIPPKYKDCHDFPATIPDKIESTAPKKEKK